MRRGLTAAIALLTVLALLVLAIGCGSEDLSPDTVAEAADATIDAGGSRVALHATVEEPGGESLPLEGTGVMSGDGNTGRIDMDISDLAAASGERLSANEAKLSTVFSRYEIYVGGPLIEKELPGDKAWMKVDLREVSEELGTDQLMQLNQNDPRKTLEYLRGTGDVEQVGSEQVRGAETTHYRAMIDLDDYVAKLPPEQRADARKGLERLKQSFGGEDETPFDVWIDDKRLVRRMKMTCVFPTEGGGEARMDQTLEFFDFGTPVKVEIPAPSEVKDITRLAAREARKQSG
jgi:hypothetical protein